MADPAHTIRMQGAGDLPKPPVKLQATGRRVWDTVVREFALDKHDLEILTAACQARDQAEHHLRKVQKVGSTFTDRFDQPRAHPSCAEHRAWLDAFRKLMRELGLGADVPDPRPASLPRGYK